MKTWKKALLLLALTLSIVSIASFTVYAKTPTMTASTANPDNDNVNEQYPNYTGSITAPEDNTDQQLATLATISSDQAKAAALNDPTVNGGTVTIVSLDNENGNVVYSVDIVQGSTSYDVKVDAGTGNILFIDQGGQNEFGINENLED
jgi:uncharacterized membrane protein YkoI